MPDKYGLDLVRSIRVGARPFDPLPWGAGAAQAFQTGVQSVAQLPTAIPAAAELGVRKLFGYDVPQPDEGTPLALWYAQQDKIRQGREAIASYDPRTGGAGLGQDIIQTAAESAPMMAASLGAAGALAPAAGAARAANVFLRPASPGALASAFAGTGTYGQELVEGSTPLTAAGQGIIEGAATRLGMGTGPEALLRAARPATSLPRAVLGHAGGEALEEGVTSVAQDLTRAFTDQTELPALKDLAYQATVAAGAGAAAGATAGGLQHIRIDPSRGTAELPQQLPPGAKSSPAPVLAAEAFMGLAPATAATAPLPIPPAQDLLLARDLETRGAEEARAASVQDPGPQAPVPAPADFRAAELADLLQGPGRQVAPLNPVDVEAQAAQATLQEQAAVPGRQAERVAEEQARADLYVLREDLDAYRRSQATGEAPVGHEVREGRIIADPTIRNRVYDMGEAQAQALVSTLPKGDLLDPTLTPSAYEGRLAQQGTPAESAATESGVRRGPRPEEIASLESAPARIAAIAEHPSGAQAGIRQQVAKLRAARPRPVQDVGPQAAPVQTPTEGVPYDRPTGQPVSGEGQVRQDDAGVAPDQGAGARPAPRDRGQQGTRAQAVAPAAPEAPLTVAGLRGQLADAYSKTSLPKERQAEIVETAHDLLTAAATAAGETPDAFIQKRIRRIESMPGASAKQRGAVEFLQDGKAVIRIMQSGNEETIGHELFHIFRRYLKPTDLSMAEAHLNVDPAKGWTRANEEAFVKAAMRWKAKGEPPTAPLAKTFAKFKAWFADLYDSVKGRGIKTSPALEKVFRNIFTEGKGLQAEYRPTGGEVAEPTSPKAAAKAPEVTPTVPPAPEAPAALPAVTPRAVIPEPKTVDAVVAPEEEAPVAPVKPVTGIKNEVTAADRERLGLPARETPEGRSFDQMYDAGKAAIAADSNAVTALLEELEADPERIVSSDEEAGILLAYKVDLERGLLGLIQRADAARAEGDVNGELIARTQLDGRREAIRKFAELTERAGTAAGRALVARQMMSGMDYTLSHMEAEAEAAKGAKLTDAELNKVRTLYQTVAEKTAAAPARGARPRTSATIKAQTELEAAKRRWFEELRDFELAKQSLWERAVGAIKGAPGTTKSLKASLDDSAVFRQGWRVMLTNPGIWLKNSFRTFKDAWDTFGGKEVLDAVRAEIQLSPYYNELKTAKLAVKAAEEDFPSSFMARVPGVGRVYKASEDVFTAFQYRNRLHVFEKLMDVAKKSGVDVTDAAQLRDIGTLVNSLTSRGSLGTQGEKIGGVINNVFFSARKLRADIDFLTAHGGGLGLKTSFARKQAILNLAKVMAGTATILLVANALDDEAVEWDPRSADFGKIKAGNTRFDVTGGTAPILTLAARLASGATKSTGTKKIHLLSEVYPSGPKKGQLKFNARTRLDVLGEFAINKASPMFGVFLSALRGERANRKPFTALGVAEDLVVPIAISNFIELLNDTEATPALTAAGVAADFFGIGTKTYSDKKK